MSKNLFNNMGYMNGYKTYCFSDVYIPSISGDAHIYDYEIGDYIPTSNYNYIYGSNLLIIDYINKVIHIVLKSMYVEIINIHNGSLKIPEDSHLISFMNGIPFRVIDIYGNFLKISTIDELLTAIMTFPKIDVHLTQNASLLELSGSDNKKNVVISKIQISENDNYATITGYCSDYIDETYNPIVLGSSIKSDIYNEAIRLYKNKWFEDNSILDSVNSLLLNMRLLYKALENDIQRPFIYINSNEKNYTHIGKLSSFVKEFIVNNGEDELNLILDTIFLNAEFEEDYEDFIISTISISIDDLSFA